MKVQLSLSTPWKYIVLWRSDPLIFNLGTTWKWMVNFTPRSLYIRHLLYRRLAETQRRSGLFEERNISFYCWDSKPGWSNPYIKRRVHSTLIKHHRVKRRVTSTLKFNFPTTLSDSCISEICNGGNSITTETKLTSTVAGKKN